MNAILELIRPDQREEFRRFIATGEASPGFMTYFESDPDCQKAVDLAIDQLAAIFEDAESPVVPERELIG